jgi:hypothetical protein
MRVTKVLMTDYYADYEQRDSLEEWSARRKIATYTQENTNA